MENGNLELGSVDVDISQESVQILLDHQVQSSPLIFMVPSVLRDQSPSSFNPKLVSIGPLHRGEVNLQAYEGKKAKYRVNLMSRIINYPPEEILRSCKQKARTSMNKIKACYVWTETYSDDEIAEMMVTDACFILEFTYQLGTRLKVDLLGGKLEYHSVMCDLLLVENQIPFFILEEIYQCTILKFTSDVSLIKLIDPLLSSHNIFTAKLNFDNVSITNAHHILSLLYQCYMPPDNINGDFSGLTIQSAVDLDRAGVNFKPCKDLTWLMGMEVKQYKFPYFFGIWSKPTFTIPVLKVHDSTEFILRNLIAYEDQPFQIQSYVTSYAIAMDMLVNTQEDVARLIDSGVLQNNMGSNEEAANMINSICKHVGKYSFYKEEWEKLNKYCDGYWPKHIARMRRTYFSSPWSIIALLVGIILFVLQVLQTIFTIKSSVSKK